MEEDFSKKSKKSLGTIHKIINSNLKDSLSKGVNEMGSLWINLEFACLIYFNRTNIYERIKFYHTIKREIK